MKHPVASLIAAAALALAGASAHAQQYALTSKDIHLRAGPGRDYPIVAVLPPQMQVLVYGCIPSYTWCDVMAGYERGWVYSGNLLYDYGNRVVVLPSVAAIVGIGIATFIIDDYWHEHYYDRPWWPQRQRWYRPPPPREHGRDSRDHGPDYRDQGRNHRDQGRDHRDQGRDYRQPPRPGPGQYQAAPQVQRSPKDTMRGALEQPQRPQPHQPPPQQQHQPPPQQQRQQPPQQQRQQQPQQQRQQQPLPQTQ